MFVTEVALHDERLFTDERREVIGEDDAILVTIRVVDGIRPTRTCIAVRACVLTFTEHATHVVRVESMTILADVLQTPFVAHVDLRVTTIIPYNA